MNNIRIAFFDVEPWQKELIRKQLKSHDVQYFDSPLQRSHCKQLKDVEVVAAFVYSCFTKEILQALPNLKLIATMSTGVDHIDLATCKKKGIVVCNVPTYGENTVAEHTFALMLALSRKIYPSIQRTHEQQRFETDVSLRGFDLQGKTLGIIGGGNIGKHVARIGVGFAMRVLVYDPHRDQKMAKQVGFHYASLPSLLKKADIITLHVPLIKPTHHLINHTTIAQMKKGVVLINTARGGIIDTDALVKALQQGKIAAVALDVLEEEGEVKEEFSLLTKQFKATANLKTILEDHLLMKMNNVIITPHNAFNSQEAIQRILETTLANIQGFSKGKIINNVA
ncbi:hydroxyacid dehydrogenase [Candidatus Woesearchaeota archaeon]|nr:hydroxyacid dehydrogenase [Candidatus Woesearchaeota archaeon]